MAVILLGIDGWVYGQDYFPGFEIVGGAGHDGKSAVDGERRYGECELDGELVCASFERSHFAVPSAGAFGKYDKRHAVLQGLFGFLQGFFEPSRGGVVDEYMPGGGTGASHEGDIVQAFFHHPFEVVVEVPVDEEYVVGSLVVCHKDVGGVFVDVFTASHFDSDEREDTEQPRPDVCGVVSPYVPVSQPAPDEGDEGGEQREYQQYGHGDEPLIQECEYAYHVFGFDSWNKGNEFARNRIVLDVF